MRRIGWLRTLLLVVLLVAAAAASGFCEPKAKLLIKPEKPDFNIEVWTDRGKEDAEYYVGEYVRIFFRTTADAYVNIYSIMTDGRVELIFPNDFQRDNYVQAGETRSIPSGGYRLRVVGPPGTEYIQAIATRFPLFLPGEWFGRDANRLRSRIEKRLETTGNRHWATDWASIRIIEEWNKEGTVQVRSYQSSVRLYVDGRYMGTLPETVELEPGSHQLVAMKEGYRVEVRNIYISGGEYETWHVTLEPIDGKW